jgi:phosphonate transport system substrate-binding protein
MWQCSRALLLSAAFGCASLVAAAADPIRIGTTPVFLDDQATFLSAWQQYMEQRLARPVRFVQRGSYREITDLVLEDRLDFAWVCSPPYLRNRDRMVLAAVPLHLGKPLYQSYLIVPAGDRTTKGFADLQGKVYAFSDPDSNSGWLAPQAAMRHQRIDPSSHFKRTFFTWAHKKVVEAVAAGLAQGGSVDGYVWETLKVLHPELTAKTRVAWKSPWYGFPPIIARRSIDAVDLARMQELLIGMKDDVAGRRLLKQLNLDGFERGSERLFDGVEQNRKFVQGL